jgi:hypothetical protein
LRKAKQGKVLTEEERELLRTETLLPDKKRGGRRQ